MARDIPEPDIVMGELELPPQMDPKPEMVTVYDTSPPLPHQNPPPIPAETVRPGTPDMAQICAMLAVMSANMNETREEIKNNTNKMEANTKGMREEMKEMRGEMRQMGHGLQAGIMALAYDETRTERNKMATPRATTNELEGSAPAGEDRVIWETRRTRSVEVTVTKWTKLIRVTETCTKERKEQLRRKARLRYSEIVEEQGVKQREGRE